MKHKSISILVFSIFLMPAIASQAQTAILKDAQTVIYELPTTASRQLAQLKKGTKVQILLRKGEWVQLAYEKNRKGWMRFANDSKKRKEQRKKKSTENRQNALANDVDKQKLHAPQRGFVEPSKGGLSFHLGFFAGDFTYTLKFHFRNNPKLLLEGSFQYVAGKITSIYIMDASLKYPVYAKNGIVSWLSGGAGVLTNVPVRSAGAKSISNMALNYGIGIQKPLRNKTNARFDIRQFAVFTDTGLANFLEFTAGLSISL